MRPVVRLALVVAAAAALVRVASWSTSDAGDSSSVVASAAPSRALEGRCPRGTLPDGRACIPVPDHPNLPDALPAAAPDTNQLPRRSDRPEAFDRYQWPIELSAAHVEAADRPDAPLAFVLPQRRGEPVRSVKLAHQNGDAELLAVAELVGKTVVTLHTVRHPTGLRQYLVVHGRLDVVAPGLKPGSGLHPGQVLGQVGDSDAPGDVHLHLEVRQVRRHVDVSELSIEELLHPARSVPIDPRNVFPLVE